MYEEKIAEFKKQLENEHASCENAEEELNMMKQLLSDRHTAVKVGALSTILLLYVYFLFASAFLR